MYGNERVALHVPTNPNQPVTCSEHTFAHNAKLKPTTRTHISAIAVMKEKSRAGALHLDVYHNEHANTPPPPESFLPYATVTEYRLADGDGFREWIGVVPTATPSGTCSGKSVKKCRMKNELRILS